MPDGGPVAPSAHHAGEPQLSHRPFHRVARGQSGLRVRAFLGGVRLVISCFGITEYFRK
jgi:hypothetical protein